MHRFFLFAGDEINAHGGADDLICDRPTIDELKALCTWTRNVWGWTLHVKHERWDTNSIVGHWLHILDTREDKIVYEMTSFKMKQDEKEKRDTS